MDQSKTVSLEKIQIRLLHWGIFIDIFLPLLIFFLAVFLRDRYTSIKISLSLDLVFYVFLLLNLGSLINILLYKKKTWKTLLQKKLQTEPSLSLEENLFKYGIFIFLPCLSPSIIGLIYYLVGGTWERFSLFVAVTFLFFQLFKPKQEELEKLIEELKITV